jgi:hypothetical protein
MVSTVKTQLDEQNAKASQREVDQFVSEKPLVWYGYLSADETTLTTWTGQKIASVTFRSTPFRVLRGVVVRQFQFQGINGLTYYGRGQGAGMSIRIFAKKV